MKLTPCIILNLFLNFSNSNPQYSYKLQLYKNECINRSLIAVWLCRYHHSFCMICSLLPRTNYYFNSCFAVTVIELMFVSNIWLNRLIFSGKKRQKRLTWTKRLNGTLPWFYSCIALKLPQALKHIIGIFLSQTQMLFHDRLDRCDINCFMLFTHSKSFMKHHGKSFMKPHSKSFKKQHCKSLETLWQKSILHQKITRSLIHRYLGQRFDRKPYYSISMWETSLLQDLHEVAKKAEGSEFVQVDIFHILSFTAKHFERINC